MSSSQTGAANLPGLRKSIGKVVTVNNRRRINSVSEVSASPVLSKRKRSASLTEEETPAAKRMAVEKAVSYTHLTLPTTPYV